MAQTRPAAQQRNQEVGRENAMVRYANAVEVAMPGVEEILPATLKPGRFKAAAIMAFKKDPDLGGCREETIMDALREAATDGLLLDGKEAALVVRGKKKSRPGNWSCHYMPMYQGMIRKVLEAGPIATVNANVVYTNDEFYWEEGTTPKLFHRPARHDRGDPEKVYAIARFKDGNSVVTVIEEDEIEQIRACAETQMVWDKWETEQWKKSAFRRLYKILPREVTIGMDHMIEAHDAGYDLNQPTEPEDPGEEDVDTDTGEVIDQEEEEPPPPPQKSRAELAAERREQRSQQRSTSRKRSRTRSAAPRSAAQGGPEDDYQPPGEEPAGNGSQPM